jgi:hypothetical protein
MAATDNSSEEEGGGGGEEEGGGAEERGDADEVGGERGDVEAVKLFCTIAS